MGTCLYPEHHRGGGPGGRAWLAVVAAILLAGSGAASAVASALTAILVAAAVAAGLALVGAVVLVVVRAGHAVPYDAAWHEPEALPHATRVPLEAPRAQIAAPVQQHIHFHGVSAEDIAAVLAARPGIGE